ncbi:MAG: Ig-like domain-containing protein [Deltaproteobacteria bacterium]|nr:Ig-like domain-containing protein [Deltaproteobacteria bacterium]
MNLRTVVSAAFALAFVACLREPAKIVIKDQPTDILSKKGQEVQLRGVVYDKDGVIMDAPEPIVWTSSDPSVVTVSNTGLVTAQSSGTAKISASVKGQSADFTTRAAIVGSVAIEPALDQTLKFNKTMQLKVVVKDDKGQPMPQAKVRWSAASHAVDITPEGMITGQALGSTQVFATVNEKVAAVRVTVKD